MNSTSPTASNPSGFLHLPIAVAAFILLYLATGLYLVDDHHGWGGDFSLYIEQARRFVETGAMTGPFFVFNEENTTLSPYAYPFGLPLLLAPFYALFGLDISSLTILILLCSALSLVGLYLLATRLGSHTLALSTVLVFALNPYVWWSQRHILSELPFTMVLMFALFAMSRPSISNGTYRSAAVHAVVCAFLAYAAYSIRSLGITLPLAFLVYCLFQLPNRRYAVILAVYCVTFGIAWLSGELLLPTAGYNVENRYLCPGCLGQNLSYYYASFLRPVSPYGALLGGDRYYDFVPLLGVILTLAGVAMTARARFKTLADTDSKPLRFLRSFSPAEIMFLGTLLLILLLPVRSSLRFLAPLLPLVFFYALSAIWHLAASVKTLNRIGLITVCALLGIYASTYVKHYDNPKTSDAANSVSAPEAVALFEFVKANVDASDLIMTQKPRPFVLFTGRRATVFDRNVTPENIIADIRERSVTHLILGKYKPALYAKSWMLNHPVIAAHFDAVFESARYRVLKIRP